MPYAELLNELINDKALSIKEVAERCKDYGQNITASYISIIKNPDNKKIPSDDVSRALAKACEAEFEECLVLEAYYDKAPIEMKRFFEDIKITLLRSAMMMWQNAFTDEEMKNIETNLKKLPMSLLILQFGNNINLDESFNKLEGAFNSTTTISDEKMNMLIELRQPQGIEVLDNSMFPTILKGSKVVFELRDVDDYQNGDILVAIPKGDKKTIIRKCLFNDGKREKVTLYGLNQEFVPVTYSLNEISILGKVITAITEFN